MPDVPNNFYQNFDHYCRFENGNRSEYYVEYRVGYFLLSSFRWRLITTSENEAIEYINKYKEYKGYPLRLLCFSLLASIHNLNSIDV